MFIRNGGVNLIFRLMYLLVCGFAIIRHLSIHDAVKNINMLSYFTIQSNIICFSVMVFSMFHSLASVRQGIYLDYNRSHLFLKGLALLVITITGLTYNIVLNGTGFSMIEKVNIESGINDKLVHFIVPVLTWIDYLLFQPKGNFEKWDPVKWLLAPMIYFVVIMLKARYISPALYGRGVMKYPYFFFDVETYGVPYVVKYVIVFTVGTLVIGYIIRMIDLFFGMIYTKLRRNCN